MTRALVTINVGDILTENARESFRAAAKRWDAEYWEIRDGVAPFPGALKATVLNVGYEEILLLDGDMLVSATCPNPFTEFADRTALVVAPDCSLVDLQQREFRILAQRAPDCRPLQNTYFNGGMILARASAHSEMFRIAGRLCLHATDLPWLDQTPLNAAAAISGVRVHYADAAWNFMGPWRQTLAFDRGWPFILHFAGRPQRNRLISETRWRPA